MDKMAISPWNVDAQDVYVGLFRLLHLMCISYPHPEMRVDRMWIKATVMGISREEAVVLVPTIKKLWISYAHRAGITFTGYPHLEHSVENLSPLFVHNFP